MITIDTNFATLDASSITWDGWWFGPGVPGQELDISLIELSFGVEPILMEIVPL